MAKTKKTTCPKCGEEYDIMFSRCPCCHEPNNERPESRVSYLPISRQIPLFLVGLVGINVLAVITSLIVTASIKDDDALRYVLINSINYAILFIVDMLLLTNYFHELIIPFKKGRTYIAGLIGFAFLLGGSLLISYLMQLAVPSASEGQNQSVAIEMVLRNPTACIIILGFIGPFVEELTYRVGLFTLCKRASSILAYIVTTLVFALIHIDFFSDNIINELVALPDYLFAGLMFCVLYDKEGFGASYLAHVGNNLFSVISIIITRPQ